MKGYVPPTDDPVCIAWAWFFIFVTFASFGAMLWAAVWGRKAKWSAKLFANDWVRLFYVWFCLMGFFFGWMMAGAYTYGFKILHYWLGLENPPWR